ncbi:MAG: B-box zinc finger protein [Clostridia bacterium]|nr:B-box zinc finger protein [Clostridia bacterium]
MSNVPTFTPPTPTFTPPSHANNGQCCHYHPNERAVAKCARCGKLICQDCFDTYQVNVGEYAGNALCYDCCEEIVAENVKQLKKNRRSIIAQYVFTILGIILGAIIGSALEVDTWIVVVIAFVCGCLWTFIKNLGKTLLNFAKNIGDGAWLGGIFWLIIDFFKCIFISLYGTVKKLIVYLIYIIKTSGYIKSDAAALVQMKDYMEYTLVESRNVGVDLASLMEEGGALHNNSYAQQVATHGAEAAEASIRNSVVTFNEHGEIIRNFA